MKTNVEQIELQTNDHRKVLRLLHFEKTDRGMHFLLAVRSFDFACERKMYFDQWVFSDALAALRRMDEELAGEARFKGQDWEPEWFSLTCASNGHVTVAGELGEDSKYTQFLRFSFETDQTALAPLIKALATLLKE